MFFNSARLLISVPAKGSHSLCLASQLSVSSTLTRSLAGLPSCFRLNTNTRLDNSAKLLTNHLPVSCSDSFHTSPRSHAGGSSSLLENLKQLPSSPPVALLLGLGGLVPFFAVPYTMVSAGTFCSCLALYQNMYGATILSFLGGVRWGLTLPPGSSQSPDMTNLGYSVLPQLWGFGSLAAATYMDCVVVGNVGIMLGLGLSGYMDLSMPGYPAWFMGLRLCLTFGALLSMFSVLLAKLLLDDKKQQQPAASVQQPSD